MKIQKLPADARSKLQSGILITDAVQCVLELVHNSLDAEATGVAVRVDLKTYQIRVIDNGKGIEKDDLELVGKRFMTSKYHSSLEAESCFHMYGYRGQALSSLLDVSRSVTIETKSEDEGPTFVKVFQSNTPVPITVSDSGRNGTGTTVTVEDFMYTMPVRRKRISEVFDMEEIKTQLQYLAIIHYNVCFTLRNENKGLILLQTPQASNILESVKNIYGKTIAKSLKALQYEEKKYVVTGFISLKPQIQGNVQLLYINKRIVSKGVIHKFVNSLIKEYSGKKNLLGDSPTSKILKKFKSSHNVFIIQIKCPHSYYELFTNIRKVTVEFRNWKEPLKYIHKAVKRAFKDVLYVGISSNSKNHDNEIREENKKDDRGMFGTSLLVNAVKGAAAKRYHNRKSARIRKKTKLSNSKEKSDLLSSINKSQLDIGQGFDDLNTKTAHENECSNNSLESPIPKKVSKKDKQICVSEFKKTDINESFIEFYEWLKAEFETNNQAFSLYNDFLQFKSKTVDSKEVAEFISPVLGGKLKRKQPASVKKKNLEKKPKKFSNDLSLLDEEMAVVTQKQLKIFPNQHLRIKRGVQFTTEMNTCVPETLNFDFFRKGSYNPEVHSNNLFEKPECLPLLRRKEREFGYNDTLQSLHSSEAQFSNIIKFRNLTESFFHNSLDGHILPEKTFSASNTWVSHYQGSKNVEPYGENCEFGNFVSWTEVNERYKALEDFDFVTTSEARIVEFSNKSRKIAQDVEVQVNLPNLNPKKVNAMVQTLQEVPESESFENSYMFSHGIDLTHLENTKENPEENVSNPDVCNSTPPREFGVNSQCEFVLNSNKTNSNKSSDDITNRKNLTSNEFMCGHKSQASTKMESTSKETQTLGAIWTDSLTEMGYQTENVNNSYLNRSKSENKQLSQPSTLPKTIPIEEINCEISESGFCVTKRHDFVPKGLSPKFLNSETVALASLSPNEKFKIKTTIDSAQNEYLAMVKWQNELTGDCLKPSIPDGIIFEMHKKAGKMDYENPILSATLSYCAVKVHNLLHSFAFTKELLPGVEVLGQLDKKFIVTKMKISTPKKMELISLFDQHAVDERIKLEELINENITSDGKYASSFLNPPLECTLMESSVQVVSDLKEKILNFGLNAKPINGSTVSVNQVPTFLLKKHEIDLKNKKETSLADAVRALIVNIIEEVTETRGAASKIPKVLHNAFCQEACHKAIKFNKSLSTEGMIEMITKLQSCKLPFQCAHGRPSVIPIIDLEDFKPAMEERETVDLEKLKKFLNEQKED